MKRLSKIYILLLLAVFSFVSCDEFLGVDSDRIVPADQYDLSAANDTLYSMFGIFSQLQKLADSYIILGELRADLMDATPGMDQYIDEVNNLNYSKNNPYTSNIRDYYAVINNCNYVIHNIDTTVEKHKEKIMLKTYAACKAIRAWTYMQIALNFGEVTYYDKPILTTDDANAQYPVYNMDQLAPVLIADLLPWRETPEPSLGNLSVHNTNDSYFPVRFLLGDLYLWTGQYENAATEYHQLMVDKKYIVSAAYRSSLQVTNNAFTGYYSINPSWVNMFFNSSSAEYITNIATSNINGEYYKLDSLYLNSVIIPSDVAVKNWDTQTYHEITTSNTSLDTLGDQRKIWSVGTVKKYGYSTTGFLFSNGFGMTTKPNLIYKFREMNPLNYDIKKVMPYRVALLYLRYAEAVNRLGKPHLAMAVLKNGMNKLTLNNRIFVPATEIPETMPAYMDFTSTIFDDNVGIRSRGCGKVYADTTNFVIPKYSTPDSIMNWVEDVIINETALERAFEGNRFHDLMRIAIRRNDNAYLADKVAAKHTANKEAIRSKLLTRENWYIR